MKKNGLICPFGALSNSRSTFHHPEPPILGPHLRLMNKAGKDSQDLGNTGPRRASSRLTSNGSWI
jgi:hypothetical protein